MRWLKSPIGFVTATMFLNFAGLTIIIPVIPYIIERYSTHIALYVGLITAVASLCQFIAAPALGYVSDRVGRRPVILWSLLGGAAGYVIFGIGGSLFMLFLGRIIDGLTGGDTTAMYAFVADAYEPHLRTKYYGMLGAAAALGFMTGPAIGGLAGEISLTMPLFVAAGLSCLNAGWGYFVLPESLKPEHRVKELTFQHLNPFAPFRLAFSTTTLRVLFVGSFVFFLGLIMQQSNFSVFLKDILSWGPFNIGILLTVVGLVDFLAEGYLVGVFTPVWGEIRILKLGIILTAIGMILVGVVALDASPMLLYIGVVMYTLGDGFFEPAMTGLIANATEPHMQGRIQGANQATQSLARTVAPLVAGFLYEGAAYLPYFGSALVLMASMWILIAYRSSLTFDRPASTV